MKIICFPHFYYLSEVSRLVEIAKVLRELGQDVTFFSHGGSYESVPRDEGFEVVSVEPTMSPERAKEYMAFNRGDKGARGSFFSYEELKEYVPREAKALAEADADAVLIGWNLPSYLSVKLVEIPILVQQPGPFTAPFFERGMGEFAPALRSPLVYLFPYLPMNRLVNWGALKLRIWLEPFNRLASELGFPLFRSTLDMMAGDLTLVMDAPEILGISPDDLESYEPRHPELFHRPPKYRYGGPCFAKLPGEVSDDVRRHFDTDRTKLYCAMGVSGSPEVLRSIVDIVGELDLQALVVTTTILDGDVKSTSDRVLAIPHVPAHLVNPMADVAITHGGAGTIQTAIHSGTPLVGVPMHIEQAGNISLVKRHGAGLMLWKQLLGRRRLASALDQIVTDFRYQHNMHRLRQVQNQIDGAAKAAREIVRFLESPQGNI